MDGSVNGGKSFNKYDVNTLYLFIILASGDLFRAYAEINVINSIFAIKEIIVIIEFIIFFLYHKYKLNNNNIGYICILLLYSIVNCQNDIGVLLHFIFIKYITVYILTYFIFNHLQLTTLTYGCNLVIVIFGIYSIFSLFQGLLFPDSTVRYGRISGFANPSYLSLIYLYCFIYLVSNEKLYKGLWFLIVGFLTMTKTFFVVTPIILLFSIIYNRSRKKIITIILIAVPFIIFIIQNNAEMLTTYDRAFKVLIERDESEYNSMADRISRIKTFEDNNSGNFIIGYGTGKAGSAGVFLADKLNLEIKNTLDFENQYLNIYYSWGVIGLLLLFSPIIYLTYQVYRYNNSNRKIKSYYSFLITFLLYGITLNIIESFTSSIISLLFLFYGKQKAKSCNRLPNDQL